MCGRYASTSPPPRLAAYFDATIRETLAEPSWNTAPTDPVHAVLEADGERRLDVLRWGLVPWWSKDARGAARMINARAETLATKPAFREAFEKRRCIIPADGFYEWQRLDGKTKQPYFIRRTDGDPMAFAGVGAVWRTPDDRRLRTCSIVTTKANDTVAALHDRMPVILPPSAWDAWLDPASTDTTTLARLLVPAPAELVTAYRVSPAVNSVRNNGPELIAEATDDPPVGP
ncbi:MAG TPA: SOS response-associated peptidase [Acidimicrobiales bacterium]|nr:SOS response-associated peptidase [Acidimicrobiales bacterium]